MASTRQVSHCHTAGIGRAAGRRLIDLPGRTTWWLRLRYRNARPELAWHLALEQVYVKGNSGYIILMQAGSEAVLETIAGPQSKLGMVLLDMKRAAQELGKLL